MVAGEEGKKLTRDVAEQVVEREDTVAEANTAVVNRVPVTMAKINIPLMNDSPNYSHWKNLIEVWPLSYQ